MEIKATLEKPYTEDEKVEFIMYYGQNSSGELPECYEIQGEQPETLTAWGYTDSEILETKRQAKHTENSNKAKQAIEDGYIVYKEAQFETNSQTVSDMTATRDLMIEKSIETLNWLSRDDKTVSLTVDDFVNIGVLVATYKGVVWNTKYVGFKQQITNATTIAELDAIVIDYDVPTILEVLNADTTNAN